MKYLFILLLAVILSYTAFSQSEVKIGNQIWTSKNLDVSTFRNGEPIPQAKNKVEWMNFQINDIPAWCYYEFNEKNGEKYGKLYNWYAVNDSRGIAPQGYHVPSDDEWNILTEFLGGSDIAGKKMKSKDGWKPYEGDNSSGFNALPGGYWYDNGNFYKITGYGYFWSSTENHRYGAWIRTLSGEGWRVNRLVEYKDYGLSVRCIKD